MSHYNCNVRLNTYTYRIKNAWSRKNYSMQDFQTQFAANHQFPNFKIYLLLQFLSNHPKTFRICSRHTTKENNGIKLFYAFKLKLLNFENFGSQKIIKKQIKRFSKFNYLSLKAEGIIQNLVRSFSLFLCQEHILKCWG